VRKNNIDFKTASLPERIREHARVMFEEMPAGEQYIGARDAVMFTVLSDIADWIEKHESPHQIPESR
jgi:hypothetical protein